MVSVYIIIFLQEIYRDNSDTPTCRIKLFILNYNTAIRCRLWNSNRAFTFYLKFYLIAYVFGTAKSELVYVALTWFSLIVNTMRIARIYVHMLFEICNGNGRIGVFRIRFCARYFQHALYFYGARRAYCRPYPETKPYYSD